MTDDSRRIINSSVYSENVTECAVKFQADTRKNNIVLSIDFRGIDASKVTDKDKYYAGITIKSLPFSDWQSFIKKGYILQFQCRSEGQIDKIHIEFSNVSTNEKSYKNMISLKSEEQFYQLDLKQFQNRCNEWNSISELCFVFFPVVDGLCGKSGKAYIDNMILKKR